MTYNKFAKKNHWPEFNSMMGVKGDSDGIFPGQVLLGQKSRWDFPVSQP